VSYTDVQVCGYFAAGGNEEEDGFPCRMEILLDGGFKERTTETPDGGLREKAESGDAIEYELCLYSVTRTSLHPAKT